MADRRVILSTIGAALILVGLITMTERGAPAQSSVQPTSANSPADLSAYQKEALTAIKDMTTNLLFLATGVFALVGGYLSKDNSRFEGRRVLMYSFLCFGLSLAAGLILYMGLINQLQAEGFDPNDALLRWSSIIQILAILSGCMLFFLFLSSNIKAKTRGEDNDHS